MLKDRFKKAWNAFVAPATPAPSPAPAPDTDVDRAIDSLENYGKPKSEEYRPQKESTIDKVLDQVGRHTIFAIPHGIFSMNKNPGSGWAAPFKFAGWLGSSYLVLDAAGGLATEKLMQYADHLPHDLVGILNSVGIYSENFSKFAENALQAAYTPNYDWRDWAVLGAFVLGNAVSGGIKIYQNYKK